MYIHVCIHVYTCMYIQSQLFLKTNHNKADLLQHMISLFSGRIDLNIMFILVKQLLPVM